MSLESQAKQVETKTVPLRLEIAKHCHRMKTLKGDRDPDTAKGRHRIAWLYGLLRAGLFHSPTWSYVKLLPKNPKGKPIELRVDGGHSSRMLVEAGPDFPDNLEVTIRIFEARNMEQVIELYEQFNAQGSTRTTTDLIKNRKAYEPELEEMSPSSIRSIINGIACHLKLRNPREEYEVLDLIRPHAKFIAWCGEFVSSKQLRRPGVLGAIFATYKDDSSNALEFWRRVRDETGPAPECATRMLGRFLHDCLLKRSRLDINWSSRAYYVKCHHAWNAWRRGDGTNLKYHPNSDLPELL